MWMARGTGEGTEQPVLPGWEPEPRPHLGPQVCTLDHQRGHGRQKASSGPGFSPLAELGWGQAPGHLVGALGDSTGRGKQEADWVILGDVLGPEFLAEMLLRLKS